MALAAASRYNRHVRFPEFRFQVPGFGDPADDPPAFTKSFQYHFAPGHLSFQVKWFVEMMPRR